MKPIRRWEFLFCLLVCLTGTGCDRGSRRPGMLYISESYYGWVRIEYSVKGTPELPAGSAWKHESFPSSGLLQTSSELKPGFVEFNYDTVMEWRKIPNDSIHGRISSENVTKPDGSRFEREFETLFIGSQEAYEKHRNELERFRKSEDQYVIPRYEDLPKVGNTRH